MDEATTKAIEESTATDQAIITTIVIKPLQSRTSLNPPLLLLLVNVSILERRQQVVHLCVDVVCDVHFTCIHVLYMYVCTCTYIYSVYTHTGSSPETDTNDKPNYVCTRYTCSYNTIVPARMYPCIRHTYMYD